MPNQFTKQTEVLFEQILPMFDKQLTLSKLVSKFKTAATTMERSDYTFWRPVPYIMPNFSGIDATGTLGNVGQMSVPAQINIPRHSGFVITPFEANDQLQVKRIAGAAMQSIAAQIETTLSETISNQGTLVVARSTAPSGSDDIAQCDTLMNSQGVIGGERYMALSSSTYNSMASDLGKRETLQGLPEQAYVKGSIGKEVSGFKIYKLDTGQYLEASTASSVTINGANQYWEPKTISTGSEGQMSNVDNRYQELNINVGSGTIKAGDCLTFEGCEAVHQITKQSTGSLKTFRVISVVSGGTGATTVKISPPIISNQGNTFPGKQYQNVSDTPANGATVNVLNIANAVVNPFWREDAVELLPGDLYIPNDNSGVEVIKSSTESGISISMTKQVNGLTGNTTYVLRTFYGTVITNPEMCGIEIFNQV
jgi:hypothetical protein